MEANRRSEYASDSKHGSSSDLSTAVMAQSFDADLTTFFPFDPYKLPRSSVYIDGIYREWRSVAVEDSEDEDEDEEEGGEEEEEGEEEADEEADVVSGLPVTGKTGADHYMHGPASLIDDTGGLGESFGGMSISPARPREVAAII